MDLRKSATKRKTVAPTVAPKPSLPAVKPATKQPGVASAQPRGLDLPGPMVPATQAKPDGALRINSSPEESEAVLNAKVALSPTMLNMITAMSFTRNNALMKAKDGKETLDVSAVADVMISKVKALQKGDTRVLEEHLICQTIALESIFAEMARRASLNMGEFIEPTEVYMRLALKAQSQCRATIETLAEIKNPRPVYLNPKQVNVANGNQQVNNAEGPQQVNNGEKVAPGTRAEEKEKPANELLAAK